MNIDRFANLANIVSVFLDFKNLSAIGKLGDLFTGRKPNVSGDTKTTQEGSAGPTTIKENAAQIGELFALHGFLASYGNEPFEYKIPTTENHVFIEIVRQLKDGATKRLMQTLAAEVNTVKHKKVVGETKIKDPKDPSKFKTVPETEEWERQFNEKGPQIIRGLVWLVKYPGGKWAGLPEPERIAYVVSVLEVFKIFDNLKDDADAFKDAFTSKLRDWWFDGNRDTKIHFAAIRWVANNETLYQAILDNPDIRALLEKIEQEQDPKKQRKLHEELQAEAWELIEELQKRPGVQKRWDEMDQKNNPPRKSYSLWIALALLTLVVILFVASIKLKPLLVG